MCECVIFVWCVNEGLYNHLCTVVYLFFKNKSALNFLYNLGIQLLFTGASANLGSVGSVRHGAHLAVQRPAELENLAAVRSKAVSERV